jgi:hypothetical protein
MNCNSHKINHLKIFANTYFSNRTDIFKAECRETRPLVQY